MLHDPLLYYYQEELAWMRQLSKLYLGEHANLRGYSRFTASEIADPHMERLLEVVALSNARLRYKLQEEFPQVSHALLQTLDAGYSNPIPSMAIVQFGSNDTSPTHRTIAANAELYGGEYYDHACVFKTCYTTELLPITVKAVQWRAISERTSLDPTVPNHRSVLKLVLTSNYKNIPIANMGIDKLRFFINPQLQGAKELYQWLFQNVVAVGVANTSTVIKMPLISASHIIGSVGFAETENVLPYHGRDSWACHLIKEFLVFPEKFRFFELKNLNQLLTNQELGVDQELAIYFFADAVDLKCAELISVAHFSLNCTPIINLFTRKSEPILQNHTKPNCQIIPAVASAQELLDIYAVQRVFSVDHLGKQVEYHQFYQPVHSLMTSRYQVLQQKAAGILAPGLHPQKILLGFANLAWANASYNPKILADTILYADLHCTNGFLPSRLLLHGANSTLKFAATEFEFVKNIQIVTAVTAYDPMSFAAETDWRYVARLSLNHSSLIDAGEGIATLTRLLQLYAPDTNDALKEVLQGLLAIHSKAIRSKKSDIGIGKNLLLSGTEIMLTVDESKFVTADLYLLGAVLNYFFAFYTAINSFIQFCIKNAKGEILRYPLI